MLLNAFLLSCMNRASVFEWHKRFKEGRESVSNDERCGRSKEVIKCIHIFINLIAIVTSVFLEIFTAHFFWWQLLSIKSEVWAKANLFKSPGLFSVFWPILMMLLSFFLTFLYSLYPFLSHLKLHYPPSLSPTLPFPLSLYLYFTSLFSLFPFIPSTPYLQVLFFSFFLSSTFNLSLCTSFSLSLSHPLSLSLS